MKKNLIVALALVFVLGIAGTAFAAANPFVDVPAKHWAYDAVSKLAQAGILDGYGDGTYRGERLATRYEMAQATAKAMARSDKANAQLKALIDKLAVEFAAELNNLGVRVAKLEKNASSIKFWGDSRIRYMSNGDLGAFTDNAYNVKTFNPLSNQYNDVSGPASVWNQRLRIYTKADLNEKAAFYGRIMAEWTFSPNNNKTASSIAGTKFDGGAIAASNVNIAGQYGSDKTVDLYWDYGYFEWTINPALQIAIGRQQVIAAQDLFWTNGGFDAIQFKFGAPKDNFKAKIGYGDVGSYVAKYFAGMSSNDTFANLNNINYQSKPVIIVDANLKLSKDWSANAAMFWSLDQDNTIFNVTRYGSLANTTNTSNPAYYGALYEDAYRPVVVDAMMGTDAGHFLAGKYANGYPFQVYNLGVRGQLGPDWNLRANYWWNTAPRVLKMDPSNSHNAWMAELWWMGADKAKVGSWGLALNYRDIKPWAMDTAAYAGLLGNSAVGGVNTLAYGQKGWGFQANYTFSKNAVLTFTYETLTRNHVVDTRTMAPFYYLQANIYF